MTAIAYSPPAIKMPSVGQISCNIGEIALGHWHSLNQQFFHLRLLPIPILWSRRLTSSLGVFVGYRRNWPSILSKKPGRADQCLIRLSIPLFQNLTTTPLLADKVLRETVAHEMIHQWQFQVLREMPNHGASFRQLMHHMNAANLAVRVYHRYAPQTNRPIRFVWACQNCGLRYPRQRRSINPRRHRCGRCHGILAQIDRAEPDRQEDRISRIDHSVLSHTQLALPL